MTTALDLHLGRRLRRRRRIVGLTQLQLADACGLSFQQVQKYESAANRMTAGRVWQVAVALGVPVGYFYEGFQETGADDGQGSSCREEHPWGEVGAGQAAAPLRAWTGLTFDRTRSR